MSKKPHFRKDIDSAAFKVYHGSGWVTIPLHHWDEKRETLGRIQKLGKIPIHRDWNKRSYDTTEVIKTCTQEDRNMGVRLTDRQLVVDVDPRNGGHDGFRELCADLELVTKDWPRVDTGGGGIHYYMKLEKGVRVMNALRAYPGVEFKSINRQVVAAGSRHPDTGNMYRWNAAYPALSKAPYAPKTLVDIIRRSERATEAVGQGEYSADQIGMMLTKLDPLDFQDHHSWLPLMMAVHCSSGGDARDEFIQWSVSDPKYQGHESEIGKQWDSLRNDTAGDLVTGATLRMYLDKAGANNVIPARRDAAEDFSDDDELGEGPHQSIVKTDQTESDALTPVEHRNGLVIDRRGIARNTLENALVAINQSELRPAFDDLRQNVVFRGQLPWQETFGRLMDDQALRLLRLFLMNQHQGVAFAPSKDNVFEAASTLAYQDKFNPVLEYLDGLPDWDGTQRVRSLFASYFNCGDDEYTRAVSTCFLIGAVRRQRKPGCKFDTMPVLKGKQGWNKSSALKALFGAEYFSDAELGKMDNKDAAMLLRGIWLQEFAEIDSLTTQAVGILKAFLSRATDRMRDPYDKVVSDKPRRCVLAATVNEGGYLKDTTGSRRFWPLDVKAIIDVAAIERDRDMLWAEANMMEERGDSLVLPEQLWAVAGERQIAQTTADPWVETLGKFLAFRQATFHKYDPSSGREKPRPPGLVHTEELFDALALPAAQRTKGQSQRLRTVMESGLRWTHKVGVRIGKTVLSGYSDDEW